MLVLCFLARSWPKADPNLVRTGYSRRHEELIMLPPPALASRYQYWKLIGEGGFGQVYKATRVADGKVSQSRSIVPYKVPITRLETHYSHGSFHYTCRHSRSSFFPYVAIPRKGTDSWKKACFLRSCSIRISLALKNDQTPQRHSILT